MGSRNDLTMTREEEMLLSRSRLIPVLLCQSGILSSKIQWSAKRDCHAIGVTNRQKDQAEGPLFCPFFPAFFHGYSAQLMLISPESAEWSLSFFVHVKRIKTLFPKTRWILLPSSSHPSDLCISGNKEVTSFEVFETILFFPGLLSSSGT
jgi:hypothetical protein